MPMLTLLCFAVQLFFAIHVIRSGRERYWIYIILIPALGCLVYFFTQLLPELKHNRTIARSGRRLAKAINPQRELQARKDALAMADTIDHRIQLADECVEAGLYADAIRLYESCLKGLHAWDPHVMLKLANTHFTQDNATESKQILETLIEKNPDFKSLDGHLLYARALERLDLREAALAEYKILATSFPGEEARVRYGLLLQKTGDTIAAQRQFDETLLRAKRAPNYYQKKEKAWIVIAQTNC